MAMVDVFLSYTHLDNKPDLSDQQGWVSIFQSALRTRLSKCLGREAAVWWDQREIRGDREFDRVIEEACESTRVMVAVLSPRYLESESCRKEVACFERVMESSATERRLVVVKLARVTSDDLATRQLPLLRRAADEKLGYAFYYDDESSQRRRELNTYDPTLRPTFQRRLEDLAQDIAVFLHSSSVVDSNAKGEPPPHASGAVPRRVDTRVIHSGASVIVGESVFLAAAASDVAYVRDSIQLELTDRNVPVVAPGRWSEEYQAVVDELKQTVAGVSLSVQVIGAVYGSRPEGSDHSVSELHFDLLEQVARARPPEHPLIRLVWLDACAEPKGERQKAFIERLRSYEAWLRDDEFLTGTHERLKERISAKLRAVAARRLERERQEKNDLGEVQDVPRVYVISHQRDHERARAVELALQQQNWEVLSAAEVSADAENEEERERQHQEYLGKSDAFVIYHGNAKFCWVRAQADEAHQARIRSGKRQLAGSVYVARPIEDRKAMYTLNGIQRLDETCDDPGRNLQPFVDRFTKEGGHRDETGAVG